MNGGDVALFAGWSVVLAGALFLAFWARGKGVGADLIRDALHVGCGVWVLGWTRWNAPLAPIVMAAIAALIAFLLPLSPNFSRWKSAISSGNERWAGIALYTTSYAVLTAVAFLISPFAAAAALLALSFGDGIGGFIGRTWGRLRYATLGKTKTVEGSVAVAVASAFGVGIASCWFDVSLSLATIAAAGILAAFIEAVAPRASDNVLLPAAVWAFFSVGKAAGS